MTGGNQMTITEIVAIIALVFQGFLVWLAYSAIKRNELTAKKRAIVDHIIKQRWGGARNLDLKVQAL